MVIKKNLIALYTLVRRELVRMFRIASQVFLPPVITTALYFLIFGNVIGERIGKIQGQDYCLFIAPGLIMMAVISNAYSNVSTSVFSVRFQKSIEEVLVSPMHFGLLLLGYVFGGVLRGLIVAILVFIVAAFFLPLKPYSVFLTLTIIILVAALFSLAGFSNGILARNFDDVMIVPTFVLTPLTYLGGVFYSISMLPPIWSHISHFNPIMYMIQALRYAMLGHAEVNFPLSFVVISGLFFLLIIINVILLKKGTGLRD